MNSEVTNVKDNTKATVSRCRAGSSGCSTPVSHGEKAPSPTMPPMIATALRPICTSVKKGPGCACRASTRTAAASPSSASTARRALREAATEISDTEKKALMATSSAISSMFWKKSTSLSVPSAA